MMSSELITKLRLKSGQRAVIMNAPEGYIERLGPLPEGVTLEEKPDGTFDFVQLFVRDRAEVERFAPQAMRAAKPDGLLWICYPKKSSKIKTDITRDVGWETIRQAGFDGVALVSIDDTWSAMRFRPSESVKTKRDKPGLPPKRDADNDRPHQERFVAVPEDLQHALNASRVAAERFANLAYSHRKEFVDWINGAKKAETRASRIAKTVEKLEKGLKRPSDKG